MCSSVCVAICCSPLFLLLSLVALAWNERHYACQDKALFSAQDQAKDVGCFSTPQGSIGSMVLFSCDLKRDGLSEIVPTSGDFSSGFPVGTGLGIVAEMLQCVEHSEQQSQKHLVGGAGTTQTTQYSYSREWLSTEVDSSKFRFKQSQTFVENCGAENPPWPAAAPRTGNIYAENADVGHYTLSKSMVEQVPLTKPIVLNEAPSGWSWDGNSYTTEKFKPDINRPVGKMRVSFKGNDWDTPRLTVLGELLTSGGQLNRSNADLAVTAIPEQPESGARLKIHPWQAPDSWLCSGIVVSAIAEGDVSREVLFESLKRANEEFTWILRLAGFLLAWIGFCMLAGPLEVAADCIPCIGPCLGDQISSLSCCVACFPAATCAAVVIGVVWLSMRPLIGGPILAVAAVLLCGMTVARCQGRADKQAKEFEAEHRRVYEQHFQRVRQQEEEANQPNSNDCFWCVPNRGAMQQREMPPNNMANPYKR